MPLRKYLEDATVTPEVASAMVDAFAAVTARASELGHEIIFIVQKLVRLVGEGETNAQRLTEALFELLTPNIFEPIAPIGVAHGGDPCRFRTSNH